MFKQILGEAFPVLEKVAPLIASVVGTPAAGSAAVVGMNLLSNALGLNPANVEQVGPAILANPDANNILASLEDKFSVWFKNAVPQMKELSSMEINIKMTWDPSQTAAVPQIPPQ